MGSAVNLGLALLCGVLCAGDTMAQPMVSAKAGMISRSEGAVFLDGNQLPEGAVGYPQMGVVYPQMKDGQSLRTANGRAQVSLAPDVLLNLGVEALLRIDDTRLTETKVVLQRGEARIDAVPALHSNNNQTLLHPIRIRVADSVVELTGLGRYLFDADGGRLWIYRGHAFVRKTGSDGSSPVELKSGNFVNLTGTLGVSVFRPEVDASLRRWNGPLRWLIVYVAGDAYLDDEPVRIAPAKPLGAEPSQIVRTAKGMTEISAGGTFFRLDEASSLRADDMDAFLEEGALFVDTFIRQPTRPYTGIGVHAGESIIEFKNNGLYQLDARLGTLHVYDGEARVQISGKTVKVTRGKVVDLRNSLSVSSFDPRQLKSLTSLAAVRTRQVQAERRRPASPTRRDPGVDIDTRPIVGGVTQ